MSKQQIISQAQLGENAQCKVFYNKAKDMVEIELGGTSLRFEAHSFIMVNEMMRKAAAKLVMQTQLLQSQTRYRNLINCDYAE